MGYDLCCYLDLGDGSALAEVAARMDAERDPGADKWEHHDRIAQAYRETHMPGFPAHHDLFYEPPSAAEAVVDPHEPHAHEHSLHTACASTTCATTRRPTKTCEPRKPGSARRCRGRRSGLCWGVHDAQDALEAADALDEFFPGEFTGFAEWLRSTASHGALTYWLSC